MVDRPVMGPNVAMKSSERSISANQKPGTEYKVKKG